MLIQDGISLRPIKKSDAVFLFEAINSPELVCFNAAYRPIDEIQHLKWLALTLKDKSKEFFIINIDNDPIGSIQLIDINYIHRNAELTVRICNKNYLSLGIGSKAVSMLCNHAFFNLGLIRVWLRVFVNNARAINAYKKVGFVVEGVMKKAAYINGEFIDILVMAKLKDEI